jgi:hypothetical protein
LLPDKRVKLTARGMRHTNLRLGAPQLTAGR